MEKLSVIKHSVLLLSLISVITLFAFTLEKSEINDITKIEVEGNTLLNELNYIDFAQLSDKENTLNLSISLIRDRLEKHPYVKNIDVEYLDRGIVKITVYEKSFDALFICNSQRYLLTDKAEIVPFINSTKNIDLPVITSNSKNNVKVFGNACEDNKIFSALKIISTAKMYDSDLYETISEINISQKDNISIYLSNLSSPVYFGSSNEIEKTVYLSKIYKQIKKNDYSKYIKYIDLRFNDLVYLGFDEQLNKEREAI